MLLAVLAIGCSPDEADEITDIERQVALATRLLDGLDLPGAVEIAPPATLEDGPRIEQVCAPDALDPGQPFQLDLVVTNPSLDAIVVHFDYARHALRVPIEPDADGRVTVLGRSPDVETDATGVVLRVAAAAPEGQGLPVGLLLAGQPRQPGALRGCTLAAHRLGVSALAFGGPDDNLLATASLEGQIGLYSLAAGRRTQVWTGHEARIGALTFGPDENVLVSGGPTGTVRVWDFREGSTLAEYTTHMDRVAAVEVSPDGRWLASGGWDGVVRVFDVATRTEVQNHQVGDRVNAVSFSPDGQWLAAGTGRLVFPGQLIVWPVEGDTPHLTAPTSAAATAVEFTMDSQAVVVGAGRGDITVHDLDGDEPSRIDGAPDDLASSLIPLPDGIRMLLSTYDGRVALGDAERGVFETTSRLPFIVEASALSPSGRWLALGTNNGMVRIYSLADLTF